MTIIAAPFASLRAGYGFDEGSMRWTRCVHSVGAGLLDCPAGADTVMMRPGRIRYPVPGQAGQAVPYKRRWALRF